LNQQHDASRDVLKRNLQGQSDRQIGSAQCCDPVL
jgi:hypothetical protein